MGSTKSPHDGPAVAKHCYAAAVVYACFIGFCGCQVSSEPMRAERLELGRKARCGRLGCARDEMNVEERAGISESGQWSCPARSDTFGADHHRASLCRLDSTTDMPGEACGFER
jgi:hypothetical protein